jgi:hypothetical protein
MATIHTLRTSNGGKAKVSVSTDVQPSAVRTVTCTIVSISPGRPLPAGTVQGNAAKTPAVGDIIVLTETPATRPNVPPWHITASVTG